jgi:hypothetical protein
MFYGCTSISCYGDIIKNIAASDISNITNMEYMFYGTYITKNCIYTPTSAGGLGWIVNYVDPTQNVNKLQGKIINNLTTDW